MQAEDEMREADADAPTYWVPEGRCPYGMDCGKWVVSMEELAQHNSTHSCWLSIDGTVYDVTDWLQAHPGGAGVLLAAAGGDASAAFRAQSHSATAIQRMQDFKVGVLNDPELNAKRALAEIHPSIRYEITKDMPHSEWAAMTFVERLEHIRSRLAEVEHKFTELEPQEPLKEAATEPSGAEASPGKCPYGFDKPEQGKGQGSVGQGEEHNEPMKCPISGKTGVCPMQAMHKNQTAPPAAAKGGKKQSKAAPGAGNSKRQQGAPTFTSVPGKAHPEDCVIA